MKFTKNMKPDELQDHIFATYANLRIGVAVFAIVFPLLLWAGGASIKDAYKFGCVQAKLQGLPNNLTPMLFMGGEIQKSKG
jgi:hypothetical protein